MKKPCVSLVLSFYLEKVSFGRDEINETLFEKAQIILSDDHDDKKIKDIFKKRCLGRSDSSQVVIPLRSYSDYPNQEIEVFDISKDSLNKLLLYLIRNNQREAAGILRKTDMFNGLHTPLT